MRTPAATVRHARTRLAARVRPGPERDRALLLAKSALAGVLAWTLAVYALRSAQPTYAAFTALSVVQWSVRRSLTDSARYVLAVALGVGAAGAAVWSMGHGAAPFALTLFAATAVGSWPRLGSWGVQVPVASVFAFHALSVGPAASVAGIVAMVGLGAVVGVLVNVLILPPLRYDSADEGVTELARAVTGLVREMADGLREDPPPTREHTTAWVARAAALDTTALQARRAIENGAESVSLNPRAQLDRSVPRTFTGYRTMVDTLARAGEQVRSIAGELHRSRAQAEEEERTGVLDREFLRGYGDFLQIVADTAQLVGTPDGDGEEEESPYRVRVAGGHKQYAHLVEQAAAASDWPAIGALVTDARRLLEDLDAAHIAGALQPSAHTRPRRASRWMW